METQQHTSISITIPMDGGDELILSYRIANFEAAGASEKLRAFICLLERLDGRKAAQTAVLSQVEMMK